jgi:hypothetical protein
MRHSQQRSSRCLRSLFRPVRDKLKGGLSQMRALAVDRLLRYALTSSRHLDSSRSQALHPPRMPRRRPVALLCVKERARHEHRPSVPPYTCSRLLERPLKGAAASWLRSVSGGTTITSLCSVSTASLNPTQQQPRPDSIVKRTFMRMVTRTVTRTRMVTRTVTCRASVSPRHVTHAASMPSAAAAPPRVGVTLSAATAAAAAAAR